MTRTHLNSSIIPIIHSNAEQIAIQTKKMCAKIGSIIVMQEQRVIYQQCCLLITFSEMYMQIDIR